MPRPTRRGVEYATTFGFTTKIPGGIHVLLANPGSELSQIVTPTMADPNADREWIQRVLERYERGLVLSAQRILGDLERARDVVQETLLKLLRQEPRVADEALATWLHSVCRNASLDVRRKEQRMRSLDDVGSHERGAVALAPRLPEKLEREDRATSFESLLRSLPERQREVLRLKFQTGLSYKEIGEVTETSVSHVGVLVHKAIKALRERFAAAQVEGVQP